jgi:ribulose 1,5-bisphosphate carboxylase large subunit-like protein
LGRYPFLADAQDPVRRNIHRNMARYVESHQESHVSNIPAYSRVFRLCGVDTMLVKKCRINLKME